MRISMERDLKAYCLTVDLPNTVDQITVEVKVRYFWDEETGWNHYSVFMHTDMGDTFEVKLLDEFEGMYRTVLAYEGREAAQDWLKNTNIRAHDEHGIVWETAQEMIKRWEAMLTLKLFEPIVTF
jgi:hypothetical protein